MATTLADLLATKSVDQVLAELLTAVAAMPTTAWQEGSVPRTLLKADATALADLHQTVALIAAGGFGSTAVGAWQTLFAKSRYDLDRFEATFAAGVFRVACAGSSGPYTITASALLVTTPSGKRYRSSNTSNVVVSSGGYQDIPVKAESPGSDFNIAAATALTIVSPAFAGLSVTNPALGGSSTWQTTIARDAETDDELRERSRERWGTLGGFNDDAVKFWASSATLGDGTSAGITRVKVDARDGLGGYRVLVAGANGAASGPEVTAAQASIDLHKNKTDTANVVTATNRVVTVTAQVFARGGLNSDQITELGNRLFALASSVDIAETLYLSDLFYELSRALSDGTVVDHVEIASPSVDTALGAAEVLQITPVITSGTV